MAGNYPQFNFPLNLFVILTLKIIVTQGNNHYITQYKINNMLSHEMKILKVILEKEL